MNSSTHLRIDPAALERVSLSLRHAALALLEESALPPPDTGSTRVQTEGELAALTGETVGLASEVQGLADGLEAVLRVARDTDGEVAWVFDALLAGALS